MEIICISAGMLMPKKGNETFRKQQRYLNYGLLSLASLLRENSSVFHGDFSDPLEFLDGLSSHLSDCKTVLLSIPSFYALPWTIQFVSGLCDRFPNIELHIGGRWVVDGNIAWLQQRFPPGVIFHEGLGESTLQRIIPSSLSKNDGTVSRMSRLDYSRLHRAEAFNPSIEVSRGCGMGCQFCQEASIPLTALKDPADVLLECKEAEGIYGYNPNFYFEASLFAPGQKWIDDLASLRSKSSSPIKWRTETRADAVPAKRMPSLYSAGLRYLDIGLESADPGQLLAMKKTRNPERYLDRAREALEACSNVGIKCKVNILLYPGETRESIERTVAWLSSAKDYISGVSAYPVLLFGLGQQKSHLQKIYRDQGANGFQDIGVEGIEGVDLSPEMTHYDAQQEALDLSRMFMDKQQYFDLKSFSYFDPRYSYDQFCKDIECVPAFHLPFRETG